MVLIRTVAATTALLSLTLTAQAQGTIYRDVCGFDPYCALPNDYMPPAPTLMAPPVLAPAPRYVSPPGIPAARAWRPYVPLPKTQAIRSAPVRWKAHRRRTGRQNARMGF
jgi:hypothetical protein